LQREVQNLRGIVEEQGYLIQRMETQARDRYLDLDRRLSGLSGEPSTEPPPPAPAPPAVPGPSAALPPQDSAGATAGQAPAPGNGAGAGTNAAPPPSTGPATTNRAPPAQPQGEQDTYRTALNLLLEQ